MSSVVSQAHNARRKLNNYWSDKKPTKGQGHCYSIMVFVLKTPVEILFVCLFTVNTVPVKGHWGRWGPWTKCSRTCGQGYRTRSRQCDDPRPLYGGTFCSGTLVQLEPCQLKKTCKSKRLHLNFYYISSSSLLFISTGFVSGLQ